MSEMSPAEEVFFAALERRSPADRAAYLDEACAGQPELRARVEKLLAAHPRVGAFLDSDAPGDAADAASHSPLNGPAEGTRTFGNPAATGSFRVAPTAEEAEGVVIAGRYKLRQQIGEGGMGTVWMADQTEPVKRKVAVKLIRVERGQSKTILARFEAERQAIALMDHPHIAKLLDAGTTETGSPFFVMELVKGIPLNDFCDAHKLTIPERLALFQQICSAVQHAHQKGIIHRDLKPSNVLVESHDGKPVPKVIDFGLAKATTGLQLTEQSMFTAFGSVMGTPAYMAPEQASFNAVDVDTRADVYALGVILYELLTGTTPLTKDTLKKAALDEMLKLIREEEAPTPSSRLSSVDSAPSVAANRRIEPAKLGRFVKGELDWIVLKALSKDRGRRYETANGFAKDIERFLNHEPVTAGPPSVTYKLRKFVRRNRPQVIAASLVLLALVAGVVGTMLGMIEARNQRDAAELARRSEAERAEGERQAKLDAEGKAEQATAVSEFLRNDILAATAFRDTFARHTGGPITIADAADAAAAEVGKRFPGRPLVEALIRSTLGNTFQELRQLDKAGEQLEESVRLFRLAKGDEDDAESVLALLRLAWVRNTQGRHAESERLHAEAVRRAERVRPEHDALRQTAYSHYAVVLTTLGQFDRAEEIFGRAIAERVKLGETADLQMVRSNLAILHFRRKQFPAAEELWRKALTEHRRLRGDTHPNTLMLFRKVAQVLCAQGKWAEAEPFARDALTGAQKALGDARPPTDLLIEPRDFLSEIALRLRRSDEHRTLVDELLAVVEPRPLELQKEMRNHLRRIAARAGGLFGHTDQAVRVYEVLRKATQADFDADDPQAVLIAVEMSQVYLRAGRGADAVATVDLWLPKVLRSKDPALMIPGIRGAALSTYEKFGEYAKAEALHRQQLAILEMNEPNHWRTFNTRSLLGGTLLGQKKYADAEPLLVQGYEGLKARETAIPRQAGARIPEALDRLIELYTVTKKPDEAKKYRDLRAKYPMPKEIAPPPRVK